eukprot:TRINITY_DN9358_c0_g1_i1.p1 TRINITY_DN9358_c0_g1~~TRINITY_DN9358_c0_g1_i1.p1  ORF type:complete len:579 (-),score=118.17 TRINITY_DN9358_c0_g1_i1:837-2573(-)
MPVQIYRNVSGMRRTRPKTAIFIVLLILICCGVWYLLLPIPLHVKSPLPKYETIFDTITDVPLAADIGFLSSNLLEGRSPGTHGEALAVEYIVSRYRNLGLEGIDDHGAFIQRVPLIARQLLPDPVLKLSALGISVDGIFGETYTVHPATDNAIHLDVNSVVFAGFGIVAKPYQWNDYKSTDVRGKVVVLLVGEPDATESDPTFFAGDALTYYGRWTYKVDEARALGASAVVLIHTEDSTGYPFVVLSALKEKIALQDDPFTSAASETPYLGVIWLCEELGTRLAQLAGASLKLWREAAQSRNFHPSILPVSLELSATVITREISGLNTVAILRGSTAPHEAVVVMAHHDHLGFESDQQPDETPADSLYNGAVDNASGVAAMLAVANAMVTRHQSQPLHRSVLFVTLTAEEHGLLGAEYYAAHPPLISLANTVAVVNFDVTNVWGASTDIVGLGADMCGLSAVFSAAAEAESLAVGTDPVPQSGSVYRTDSWALTARGVPSLYLWTGEGSAEVAKHRRDYVQQHYHRPSDDIRVVLDLAGTVQQARVGARVVLALSGSVAPRSKCARGWGIAPVDEED